MPKTTAPPAPAPVSSAEAKAALLALEQEFGTVQDRITAAIDAEDAEALVKAMARERALPILIHAARRTHLEVQLVEYRAQLGPLDAEHAEINARTDEAALALAIAEQALDALKGRAQRATYAYGVNRQRVAELERDLDAL